MNDYRINNGYAKALFLLSEERGESERVADDMKTVQRVCAENRQLAAFFANPTMPQSKKAAVLADLFGGAVCELTQGFLRFLTTKNRSVNLRGISAAYLEIFRESRGIVLSHLVTHQPVTAEAQDNVRRLVSEYTGKHVELDATTDPKMLGSFKLEFDNKMYDARLRTKIRKLRIAFADNEYESKL